jgi:hypothetical protein
MGWLRKAELVKRVRADKSTRQSFEQLAKAAGSEDELLARLQLVVSCWNNPVGITPWRDAAKGVRRLQQHLRALANEIEEVNRCPIVAMGSVQAEFKAAVRRTALGGGSLLLAEVMQRVEHGPKSYQRLPALLRECADFVATGYRESRDIMPRNFSVGNAALVHLIDLVRGPGGERNWRALADVLSAVTEKVWDEVTLRMLYNRSNIFRRAARIAKRRLTGAA